MIRSLKLIVILAFASLALTACGKRGTLDAPPAEEVAPSKHTSKEEPHRDFILDGLLR